VNEPLLEKVPHIWIVDLNVSDEVASRYVSVLSADERSRAGQFRFKKDRVSFIAARAALRQLLSCYVGTSPGKIRFVYSEFGKPILEYPNAQLQFNVSHAHRLGLIGVSRKAAIGVDVEFLKFDDDLVNVAKRFFSVKEVNDFLSLPESEQSLGFFNCWTRKESFIKAVGHGLSFPLDQFSVTLRPHEKAALVETHFDPEEKHKWTLKSVQVPQGYVAAFALPEIIEDYNIYRFEH
jgi:4'-phosphopantetheinyl transferase